MSPNGPPGGGSSRAARVRACRCWTAPETQEASWPRPSPTARAGPRGFVSRLPDSHPARPADCLAPAGRRAGDRWSSRAHRPRPWRASTSPRPQRLLQPCRPRNPGSLVRAPSPTSSTSAGRPQAPRQVGRRAARRPQNRRSHHPPTRTSPGLPLARSAPPTPDGGGSYALRPVRRLLFRPQRLLANECRLLPFAASRLAGDRVTPGHRFLVGARNRSGEAFRQRRRSRGGDHGRNS